jgi:hypothetical protein
MIQESRLVSAVWLFYDWNNTFTCHVTAENDNVSLVVIPCIEKLDPTLVRSVNVSCEEYTRQHYPLQKLFMNTAD